jgi:hypothetical protein
LSADPRRAELELTIIVRRTKLTEDLNLDELKRRLKEGDYLEISTGGGAYEVWAEPFATPPAVYFEGEQHPISQLDSIAQRIMDDMHRGDIRCRWVEDD